MGILQGVSRISDYLDKQAVREKEKRIEKFLTVLPTYLEKQISGITDEKTLFSTIPKLSAQMYAFGPQVGQAANQILGNLADTKYREIAIGKQEKQREAGIDVIEQVYSKFNLEGGKTPDELTSVLKKEHGENLTPGLVESVLKSSVVKSTGAIETKGEGKQKRRIYHSYEINPVTGKQRSITSFDVEQDETGRYYMDDPKTPKINENLPLPIEAMDAIIAEESEERKYEKRAKDSFNKSLGLINARADIQISKEIERGQRKFNTALMYDAEDKSSQNRVYMESETPGGIAQLYKLNEKGEKISFTNLGSLRKAGGTRLDEISVSALNKYEGFTKGAYTKMREAIIERGLIDKDELYTDPLNPAAGYNDTNVMKEVNEIKNKLTEIDNGRYAKEINENNLFPWDGSKSIDLITKAKEEEIIDHDEAVVLRLYTKYLEQSGQYNEKIKEFTKDFDTEVPTTRTNVVSDSLWFLNK